jgi:prepilin-type N-terminal cleavage/methylation domain-containing protein/prepilin-type processing-associated H-X9-DG protein
MRTRRAHGFTLIELLVVIAIIAILAAMLFPVFARARESARKIQCLSNVKNISTAVQMYLSDYDRFPPQEHNQAVADYASGSPGGGSSDGPTDCRLYRRGNPYLRWPVIFDEYVKNRDVWQCPSARTTQGATFIYPVSEWLQFLKENEGSWGDAYYNLSPCIWGWPTGWGGAITDTIRQGALAASKDAEAQTAAFIQGIGVGEIPLAEAKTSSINDPSGTVVCADGGAHVNENLDYTIAYPDVCMLACSIPDCSWVDWVNCSSALSCGLEYYAPNDGSYLKDVKLRKRYARHLGGINIGFADGHAAWYDSEAFLASVKANLLGQQSGINGGIEVTGPNTIVCSDGGPTGSPTELAPGVPYIY